MSRNLSRGILAIDVGGGTQDILVYDEGQPLENCYKMVLPSQTTVLARRVRELTREGRAIFLTGHLMGGGPCVRALKLHLKRGFPVYSTPSSAKTIKDDPRAVRDMGVQIQEKPPGQAVTLQTGDIDLAALKNIMEAFEIQVPGEFAVAVQDHGESLETSNRLFRFEHWKNFLQAGGELARLAYYRVPPYLTRMKAVQEILPGALVMDTCSAALWGALEDTVVARHREKGLTLVNLGNQHTFAALVQGDRIFGLFEHHTGVISPAHLDRYVKKFREGRLTHGEVYDSGGHGCYIKGDLPGGFHFTAVTGPQRHLARELGYYPAAPHGDMMLTGSFGLVAAALHLGKSRSCP